MASNRAEFLGAAVVDLALSLADQPNLLLAGELLAELVDADTDVQRWEVVEAFAARLDAAGTGPGALLHDLGRLERAARALRAARAAVAA